MKRSYEIVGGIYLVQDGYEFDLHNNFDFVRMDYSLEERTLLLFWQRSNGNWVSSNMPKTLTIEFTQVSEFRFMPRDPEIPFTEDDCLGAFGYLVDEDWANGVVLVGPTQEPDPKWLTAIEFTSGAILAVQAESSSAAILA